jgi:hypothetical protein
LFLGKLPLGVTSLGKISILAFSPSIGGDIYLVHFSSSLFHQSKHRRLCRPREGGGPW